MKWNILHKPIKSFEHKESETDLKMFRTHGVNTNTKEKTRKEIN